MLTADELLQEILMRYKKNLKDEIVSRFKWRIGLPDEKHISDLLLYESELLLIQMLESELTQSLL